jgi:hypothetical protein
MGKIIKPFREVSVNVILTFEYDVPEDIRNIMVEYCGGSQQMYDLDILVLKPKFRKSWEVRNDWRINEKYSPEKHVIGQVLNDLNPEELKPYLWKISLCYTLPENKSKKDCVWWENEFSFIGRTNSKYCFRPDNRDMFEDDIVQTFGISEEVRPFSENPHPNIPEEEYLKMIQRHRDETELYFKN